MNEFSGLWKETIMDKKYQDIHICNRYGECIYRKASIKSMVFNESFIEVEMESEADEGETRCVWIPLLPDLKLIID